MAAPGRQCGYQAAPHESAAALTEEEGVTSPAALRLRRPAAALGAAALLACAASAALAGSGGVGAPPSSGNPFLRYLTGLAAGEEANPCSADGEDCGTSMCCQDSTQQCFRKNGGWAACRESCTPGLDPNDPTQEPWSCEPLGVAGAWGYAEGRAKAVLDNLTLEEKCHLLRGQNDGWPADRHGFAGYVGIGYSYLDAWMTKGIMPLSMNDGPQGFNSYGIAPGTSTQFPCLLAVAASFDPQTSARYAGAIAKEFVGKGANVLLGPDVEVTRTVLTGRSFETISGEDPYLGSQLVKPFIKAVQDQGIIATPKHWLNNNQEIYRQSMNVEVSDRAQHEIYMPVFKAAFDAGAASVMCSYNKVYGQFACENEKLLRELLREKLGFRGYIVSDWGATHDAASSVKAGMDIDMQTDDPVLRLEDEYHKLPDLVESGEVSEDAINEMAQRVLAAKFMVGQFDGRFPAPEGWASGNVGDQREAVEDVIQSDQTSDSHRGVAMQTILDSAVLLKNEGAVLPLAGGQKVVMVGRYCSQDEDKSYGQGSVYSGGGSGYVETGKAVTPAEAFQDAYEGATFSPDAAGAEGADVAVVCTAAHSEEGWDRENLTLPEAWALVSSLRSLNGGDKMKIVMVAIIPGAVETDWMEQVDATLVLFMPGEQVGPGLAKLLTGEASPGGRLPVSFPVKDESRFTTKQYPGECDGKDKWCPDMTADFSEGVLVGYRWNDAKGVPSAFPFGFGLTYTGFDLKDFEAECSGSSATISLSVANTGGADAAAVPQLYVGFPSLKPALRQLRGFSKVWVPAGKEAKVAFALTEADWSFYSEDEAKWVSALAEGEDVTVFVGVSSTDLVWNQTLTCKASKPAKKNSNKARGPAKAKIATS